MNTKTKIIMFGVLIFIVFVMYELSTPPDNNTIEQWDCSQDVHGININCPNAANISTYIGDEHSYSYAGSEAISTNDEGSAKYIP